MGTLREDLESAVAETEKLETAPEVEQQEVVESPETDAPPAVEEPPEGEPPEEPGAPAEPPASEAKKEPKPAEEQPEKAEKRHRVDRAPDSWRGEAKKGWEQLPLQVRQEIHRREQNITSALQESAQARQAFAQITAAAQPHAARLQELGLNPAQALERLLRADHILSKSEPKSRAAALAQLMDQYQIDVELLDAAIAERIGSAPMRNHQEGIRQMVAQELAPIRQALGSAAQRNAPAPSQTEDVAALEAVQNMSLDPKYPHFEAVRGDMADMLEFAASRGQQLSLSDAYRRAVLMNPELAETVVNARATQKLQEAGRRASSAAVSVSGSQIAAATRDVDANDLRALLSRGYDAMNGSGRI